MGRGQKPGFPRTDAEARSLLSEDNPHRPLFCYRVPGGQEIEVFLFRACGAARRILLERYHCLFSGDAPWELPEDLCFFRNGTLILGSVSHEDICFAYDERTAVCGRWETALPDAAEQIRLHPNENIKENHL